MKKKLITIRLAYYFIVSSVLGFCTATYSQDGTLDSTFGINGIAAYSIGGDGLAILPDGRFYRFGTYTSYSITAMRSTADGIIDSSFGVNGIATINYSGTVSIKQVNRSLAVQPDGKLLIAGVIQNSIPPPNADQKNLLVRFDTSGVSDLNREFGFRELCYPTSVLFQSNGKILVSGSSYYSSSYVPPQTTGNNAYVSRFTSSGSDDNSFASNGTFEIHENAATCPVCVVDKVTLQPTGKIIALLFNKTLLRLNSNGFVDGSFGTFGYLNLTSGINDIVVQPDGKIITSGSMSSLIRYTKDGIIDSSFGINGVAGAIFPSTYRAIYYDITLQTDGKILAAGSYDTTFLFSSATPVCCRFNPDGTIDSTFGTNGAFISKGFGTYAQFYKVEPYADKILIGVSGTTNPTYIRLNNSSNILPVHLLSFTAQLQDKQTHLTWTVENEQNFDRYQIERSSPYSSAGTSNGKDFTAIGSVKATHAKEYTFRDNNPFATPTPLERAGVRSFYRLKLIDRDGKFSYSKIVSVKLPSDNKFTISPNPAKDNILLQFSKTITGKSTVEITDVSGKVMLQKTVEASGGSMSVSTSTLPSGTYTVRLMNNGEEYLQKVVVAR